AQPAGIPAAHLPGDGRELLLPGPDRRPDQDLQRHLRRAAQPLPAGLHSQASARRHLARDPGPPPQQQGRGGARAQGLLRGEAAADPARDHHALTSGYFPTPPRASRTARTPATTLTAQASQPAAARAGGWRYPPSRSRRRAASSTTPRVTGRIRPLTAPAATSRPTGRPIVR